MFSLPWEDDVEPDFINDDGWEWYLDKDSTKYVQKDNPVNNNKGLKSVYVFFVRKEDEWDWVAIDNEQNILAVEQSLDALGAKLDILKVSNHFNSEE